VRWIAFGPTEMVSHARKRASERDRQSTTCTRAHSFPSLSSPPQKHPHRRRKDVSSSSERFAVHSALPISYPFAPVPAIVLSKYLPRVLSRGRACFAYCLYLFFSAPLHCVVKESIADGSLALLFRYKRRFGPCHRLVVQPFVVSTIRPSSRSLTPLPCHPLTAPPSHASLTTPSRHPTSPPTLSPGPASALDVASSSTAPPHYPAPSHVSLLSSPSHQAIKFFRKHSIQRIDAVILTHGHSDAINGMGEFTSFCRLWALFREDGRLPFSVSEWRVLGAGSRLNAS
jgi:hypothetical protein